MIEYSVASKESFSPVEDSNGRTSFHTQEASQGKSGGNGKGVISQSKSSKTLSELSTKTPRTSAAISPPSLDIPLIRRSYDVYPMAQTPSRVRDINRSSVRNVLEATAAPSGAAPTLGGRVGSVTTLAQTNHPQIHPLDMADAWGNEDEDEDYDEGRSTVVKMKKRASVVAVKTVKAIGNKLQSKKKLVKRSKSTGKLKATEEEEASMLQYQLASRRRIDPRSSFMRWWNVLMALMMVFTAFITPYEIIFLAMPFKVLNRMYVINRVVDFIFVCDTAVNLNLQYKISSLTGKRITDRKVVVGDYLRTWLLWDITAILPFDTIHLFIGDVWGHDVMQHLPLLRMVRLLRLGQLTQTMKSGTTMHFLENTFRINYSVLQISQGCVWTILYCHWVACLWMLIPTFETDSYNWFTAYLDKDVPVDKDAFSLYCVCLYWSVLTLGSTGYGDIVPLTNSERIYSCVIMLFGAYYFGYVVGTITSIVAAQNIRATEFYNTMDELNTFMAQHNLPLQLQRRLREFYRSRQQGASLNHSNLVSNMSPSLRAEVIFYTAAFQISDNRIFQYCSPDFTATLAMHMQPEFFACREKMISNQEYPTRMYFIRRGVVGMEGRIFTIGAYVGVDMLFDLFLDMMNGSRRNFSAVALTYVDSLCLNQSSIPTILQEYPFATITLRKQVFKEVFRMETLAYCNAVRRIDEGESLAMAMLRGDPLGREQWHFDKLSMIYSASAERLFELNRSAVYIQRIYRGFRVRQEMSGVLVPKTSSRRQLLTPNHSKSKLFNSRLDKLPTLSKGLNRIMSNVLGRSVDDQPASPSHHGRELAAVFESRITSSSFGDQKPTPDLRNDILEKKKRMSGKKKDRRASVQKKRYSIGQFEEKAPFVNGRSRSPARRSEEYRVQPSRPSMDTTGLVGQKKERRITHSDYRPNFNQSPLIGDTARPSIVQENIEQIVEKAMTSWLENNLDRILAEQMNQATMTMQADIASMIDRVSRKQSAVEDIIITSPDGLTSREVSNDTV